LASDALDIRDPLVGRVLDSSYRLCRRIEHGGTGTIYEAEQLRVGRPVAVKVLRLALADDRRAVERFVREAEIISQLEHPNTLKLFDFGRLEDGRPYLVTELLDGQTLAERMGKGTITVGYAARVAQDVLLSLSEAHGKGIVHRDLKPSNIFLHRTDSGERVRVLDFGIARLATSTTLTEPGMIMGTPAYMSPEQALKDEVDGRSDLYSLGAILFEMLTGRPPFLAPHPQTLILKHALVQAPRLRQVGAEFPDALDETVATLLEKEPEGRPDNALQVHARLAPLADDPTVAPPARPVWDFDSDDELSQLRPRLVSSTWMAEVEPVAKASSRRIDPTVWMGAAGVVFFLLALTLGAVRVLVPGRVDVPSPHAPGARAAEAVPARPSPVVNPLGPPAPLLHGAVPAPEVRPAPPEPVRPSRVRVSRAPPGFVDVDL
jgi:serine/threonine-protein kinase